MRPRITASTGPRPCATSTCGTTAPDFVKAFGHNGYFKSLQEIVHFYDLRDFLPVCDVPDPPKDGMGGATCFPPPEVAENINRIDMGNLGLTPQEGVDLIGFLKTLSDE